MRFGIANREITPPFPTRMHGYAVRQDNFDGVNDPLMGTAVVLEEGGRRALICAADICTFPNDGSLPGFMERAAGVVGCPPDNVVLNASHTHGGPTIVGRRSGSSGPSSERYRDWLYEQTLEAARQAVTEMREGTLWYGSGRTTLPMNRRPDRNGEVPNAPNPGGPVDDLMQLLVFRNPAGAVEAVGMKVACHPVTTGAQHLITADFVGAWRAAFSDAFGPQVTPFFLQGPGADARPRHAADGDRWRAVRHGELPGMGRELLAEMLAILAGTGLRQVEGLTLEGKIRSVQAPCEGRYTTRAQFEALLKEEGLQKSYAETCLKKMDAGQEVPGHVDFLVQTLWLNRDLALIGLDVEPLCGLGATVAGAAAPKQAILLGYTNGCIGYTPDTAEMKRGGYETTSYLYSGWTGPLMPGLEHLFAGAVARQGG
ncbi:MAG: hypothetical protein EXS64_07555 [Candidatus Latescibacteria bacterium]|nr:hypothetical protein [Candidatus Latescibacterota bacterium]